MCALPLDTLMATTTTATTALQIHTTAPKLLLDEENHISISCILYCTTSSELHSISLSNQRVSLCHSSTCPQISRSTRWTDDKLTGSFEILHSFSRNFLKVLLLLWQHLENGLLPFWNKCPVPQNGSKIIKKSYSKDFFEVSK